MNCCGCRKALKTNDFLRCRLCIGKYHYQCLAIDKQKYTTFSKEFLSTWICPGCSNVTKRPHSSDNTPVRQNISQLRSSESLNMSCDMADQSVASPPPLQDSSLEEIVTMGKISTLLDEKLHHTLSVFMADFRVALREDVKLMVKNELDAAFKALKDDFTATTDYICAEQSSLRADIDKSEKLIKTLEADNAKLKAEVIKLNSRLASFEKISRSCNIEIQAVPERKNENVVQLFKKLCDVVKIPVEDGHINACRRVAKLNPASKRPRNIIVTFSTTRVRDAVLSACYRYNKANPGHGLTSSDLNILSEGEVSRIFVTEHLSPEQKTLHAAARNAAKELGYKYVWIKYGQIYIRRNDSASAILIKSQGCINKLR